MLKARYIIIAALLSLPVEVAAIGAAERMFMEEVGIADDEQKVEISACNGNIKITAETEADVEIYTILGRFITRKHILPGVTEISVPNRGIYIVRVGKHTAKVAV